MEEEVPEEAAGVTVHLDRLEYRYRGPVISPLEPHAFIYFLTIANASNRRVTLLGRKWVVRELKGEVMVMEGDKIVGQSPVLRPGESFSYNSFHTTRQNAVASGSFHGVDEEGHPIFVRIPTFEMIVPYQHEID